MPRSPRPPRILRAAITLDGKLADGPIETVHGTTVTPFAAGEVPALLAAGSVDELHLTIRLAIDGRRDAATLTGPPTAEFLPASVRLRLLAMEPRAGECFLRYRVLRPAAKQSFASA